MDDQSVMGAYRRLAVVEAERDRARDLAAHLEEQLVRVAAECRDCWDVRDLIADLRAILNPAAPWPGTTTMYLSASPWSRRRSHRLRRRWECVMSADQPIGWYNGQPIFECGSGGSTWDDRDPESGRQHRNAHLLELDGCMWRCLICRHQFDAASDADLFACGEDCTGKHHGDGGAS